MRAFALSSRSSCHAPNIKGKALLKASKKEAKRASHFATLGADLITQHAIPTERIYLATSAALSRLKLFAL